MYLDAHEQRRPLGVQQRLGGEADGLLAGDWVVRRARMPARDRRAAQALGAADADLRGEMSGVTGRGVWEKVSKWRDERMGGGVPV
jgi:hypothetical protein